MNDVEFNILDLSKAFELNLTKADILDIPILATKLAVDRSGSMEEEFRNGWVDRTIELFLVAAMKFDDNKQLELGFFNNHFHRAGTIDQIPPSGTVRQFNMTASGGTHYSPVIDGMCNATFANGVKSLFTVFSKYLGKDNPAPYSYLGWITDGDAADFEEFKRKLAGVEKTFIQMIVIGNQVTLHQLNFLEKLYPFLDVIHFPDPHTVSNDEFFAAICNPKFKAWIDNYNEGK